MLAFATGISEFALDEDKGEHEKLARAVERVASHYNIPMLDPVTRDWLMLAKTCGVIYGSRAMAYYLRVNANKVAGSRPVTRPAPVTQAPTPQPVKAPRQEPQFIDVTVPGFEHLGAQKVQVQ